MGVVIDNVDFEERRDLVLLKALIIWVKARFARPLDIKYEKQHLIPIQELQAVDNMQKVGVISDEDAWLIEKNAILFGAVTKSFLKYVLNKELFSRFGDARYNSNRKGSVVDIALLPVSLGPGMMAEVVPCTMYIAKKEEIVKRFKINPFFSEKEVDIVPLLKSHIDNLLSKDEQKIIDNYFKQFKDDPEIIKARTIVERKKEAEDNNLRSILTAINVQGKRTDTLKLAVTLYTIIKGTYKSAAHQKIAKVRFDQTGASTIPDYSRIFYIEYDTDLELIKSILQPVVDPELKIKTGEHKILFTTASALDPDNEKDMENVVSAKIINEKGLNHVFETHVGPMASIDDVNKILDKYLQQKYQW